MAVSSVSANVTAPQSQPTQTPDKADAGKSSSDTPAQSAPAPTVLTQGTSAGHHKKKVHHPLPGQPGHQVNKSA
jgi:hypothetical protein